MKTKFSEFIKENNTFIPRIVYHGGDIENLKALLNNFEILSPEEKLQFPSTGGGNFGLSTSTDKNNTKRYSSVFGNDYVLKIEVSPTVKIKHIDTNGDGIDNYFTHDELEILSEKYDAIMETDDLAEKESRILKSGKFKPLNIEK